MVDNAPSREESALEGAFLDVLTSIGLDLRSWAPNALVQLFDLRLCAVLLAQGRLCRAQRESGPDVVRVAIRHRDRTQRRMIAALDVLGMASCPSCPEA